VLCKRNVVIFKQQSGDETQQIRSQQFIQMTPSIFFLSQLLVAFTFVTASAQWWAASASAQYSASADYPAFAPYPASAPFNADRLWVASTRHLSSHVCNANLSSPSFRWTTLDACGRQNQTSYDHFLDMRSEGRETVIYIHGNRMESDEAVERGLAVYHRIKPYRDDVPVDWVIFSWPSEQIGILARDVRIKADRTDAQGLYLAQLLRGVVPGTRLDLIGYSFGGRIATGALHALAGGSLGGRSLDGPGITGMNVDAGLVAPAIGSNWLSGNGFHHLATQNLNSMTLFYNPRDAVLKRFWLIDEVRGQAALGYTGPESFAPRIDGTKLPVTAKDCAPVVGLRHSELDYYQPACRAGAGMADLINDDVICAF
jgi:hypothetical protein